MAKLAVRVTIDITTPAAESEGHDVSPDPADELEAIIAAGCLAESFTYVRLDNPVIDDSRLNHVYEITETP